jgi:hypothetical protein
MNMHERFATTEMAISGAGAPPRPSWLGLLGARLASWVKTCADHYAAAAAYEDLSRLSDTQLKHRGLSRDILARDLSGWRGQASGNCPLTHLCHRNTSRGVGGRCLPSFKADEEKESGPEPPVRFARAVCMSPDERGDSLRV